MATPTNYQYVKHFDSAWGQYVYSAIPAGPVYGGQTQVSFDEFLRGIQSNGQVASAVQTGNWAANTGIPNKAIYDQLVAGNQTDPNYVVNDKGQLQTKAQYLAETPAGQVASQQAATENLAIARVQNPLAPVPPVAPAPIPAPVNENYFLKKNESITDYNARLASLNLPSAATPEGVVAVQPKNTDALVTQTKQMLAQTAAEGTKPFAGSSYDTITPAQLSAPEPIKPKITPPLSSYTAIVPPPPTPTPSLPLPSKPTPPSSTLPLPLAPPATPPEATQLGTEEVKLQKNIEEAMALQTQGAGRGAFQSEQEKIQGVAEKVNLFNDLGGQLDFLAQKAATIQAQTQQAGAGVTTAIDARQRAEALRLNSIESLQIQAQYNVAKGRLATAQTLANQAVDLKFKPIEDQIAAAKANIELLKGSPNISLEEKKRAIAQTQILNDRASAIDRQKQNEQDIFGLIKTAMTNGLTDATILSQANNATKAQAEQILAPYLKKPAKSLVDTEKPMSVSEIESFRHSYGWTPPFGFTQTQIKQYIADNPNATPEELEAGAEQVSGITENTKAAPNTQTPDQIVSFVTGNMNDAQKSVLKKKADVAGISSMWKPASTDVKNYLKSIEAQIQEALDAGYTQEEILAHLAS